MRNTLKHSAGLSRTRITDYRNCKPMRIFKMIRYLVEMNVVHVSVVYQDGYPHVILPISRIYEKYINSISVAYNHSYKLKYIATRSKVPSMRFIKHLGIYAHNAKRRYNVCLDLNF